MLLQIEADQSRELLEAYWNTALKEEALAVCEQDPATRYASIRSFVSTSNGKGRKKRKSRDVELIGKNQPGGKPPVRFWDVKGKHAPLDEIAHEALDSVLDSYRVNLTEELLSRLRKEEKRQKAQREARRKNR